MKLKAAFAGLSDELRNALDKLRPIIVERVIGPHLRRPDITSAGFYVQKSDIADSETHCPFCEVRLSGVSVTDDRSFNDFKAARNALEAVYAETIRKHLLPNQSVVLFVSLMLDASPKIGVSSLIEGAEVVVSP